MSSLERVLPGRGVEEPLGQYAEPVVAAVQLSRRRLLADGSWSGWEDVKRLGHGGLKGTKAPPTVADINQASRAAFEVMMDDQRFAEQQIALLQPQPYDLVRGVWLDPTSKKAQSKEESSRRRAGGGVADRSRGRQAVPTKATGRYGAEPGGDDMIGGAGRVYRGEGTGSVGQANTGILSEREVTLWAHDGDVMPAGVYGYRIRIGFFNPIAGHDWYVAEQGQLEDERILWSGWSGVEQIVQVPERVLFFPKPAGGRDERRAVVTVYRWQDGSWYERAYPVSAGDSIGQIGKPSVKRSSARRTDRVAGENSDVVVPEVDFRTGAMVVDVVPNVRRWYRMGNSVRDKATSDIIYRDEAGLLHCLPVDYNCWAQEMKDKSSWIRKALSKQEQEPDKERDGVRGTRPR